MPEYMSSVPVAGRPRHRLVWCALCSDGFRGFKPTAERWGEQHVATEHKGNQ